MAGKTPEGIVGELRRKSVGFARYVQPLLVTFSYGRLVALRGVGRRVTAAWLVPTLPEAVAVRLAHHFSVLDACSWWLTSTACMANSCAACAPPNNCH